jgi:hypothetical protein
VWDGSSIKIWQDHWIPTPSTFKVQSPVRFLAHDAPVSALIDGDTRCWNFALIQNIFIKEEADLICSIPICPGRLCDILAWVGTKNRMFTVKSAYHLVVVGGKATNGSTLDNTIVV